MLNICSPFKMHMLKPNSQGDGIWRWGFWEVGQEDGALMNGTCALIKEAHGNSLAPSAMGIYSKKMAIYEPGCKVQQTESHQPLHGTDLALQASRSVRSKFLFISHTVYRSLLQQVEQTDAQTTDSLSFSEYTKSLSPCSCYSLS